jgi:hypothetical protein
MSKDFSISNFKTWAESAQAVMAILGIGVGGLWTYMLFVKDRLGYPHATLDLSTAQVALTAQAALLQVVLKVHNSGETLMHLSRATVRIQQILPIDGCAENEVCVTKELNDASNDISRISDRFDWPIVSNREATWTSPRSVEPGEDDIMDFEFVLPDSIQVVRVYGYIPNDETSRAASDPKGWNISRIVDLRKITAGEGKK